MQSSVWGWKNLSSGTLNLSAALLGMVCLFSTGCDSTPPVVDPGMPEAGSGVPAGTEVPMPPEGTTPPVDPAPVDPAPGGPDLTTPPADSTPPADATPPAETP